MKTKRLFEKYSVDIITEEGYAQEDFAFNTNSLQKAEAKFDEYVTKEAFSYETVQLWSRIKSDEDIELVKDKKGEFEIPEENV